jgi:hypothetical protein
MSRTADAGRMRRWLEALAPSNIVGAATSATTTTLSTVTSATTTVQ